jgi:condensin complex subunit 2
MLKRNDPTTNPESPKTPNSDSKKPRESFPNAENLRTPLKNSSLSLSTSLDCLSPRRPAEEDEERRRNRAELVKKQHESREALKSPSANASPRAEPSSSITPTLKRSTSSNFGGSGLINEHSASSPSHNYAASSSSLASNATSKTTGSRSVLTASKSKLSLAGGSGKKLLSSNQPPALTAEQMTKTFDEWMKMAADNKINSKNSWSFALIDYFSELTFLRDGDSINFQKASCTLDGCVKIYASRVDSVVDETTKLLNGLADKTSKFKSIFDEEAIDEETDETGTKQKSSIKTKKSTTRTIETIEKNPENLILKNFDLEFSIDPLFKKTSAEFDESGSKGALLKNLEVSPINNLIIFDSSDQIPMDFSIPPDHFLSEKDELIDISLLVSTFGSSIIDLDRKTICPTFDEYNFDGSSSDIKETLEKLSRISSNIPQIERTRESIDVGDVENGEELNDLDGVEGDDDLKFYNDHVDADLDYDHDERNDEEFSVPEKSVKWAEKTEITDETGLSYFDSAFKQTWAGPEHWKIRKSQRISGNNTTGTSASSVPTAGGKTRRSSKVEKVAIDFASSSVDFRQIFSKPSTAGQISLTKSAILERNEQDHLLPTDLHFSSVSLLKLFINPNWKSTTTKSSSNNKMTRSSTRANSTPVESVNFLERDFWMTQEDRANGFYQDPINQEDDHDDYDGNDNDGEIGFYNMSENTATIPNEPIIPENDENNFFSNYQESPRAAASNLDFTKNLVAPPKFTNAPQINYARVAKRVDVAKLKSTLWNEFLVKNKSTEKNPETSTKTASNVKTFSNLITNLSKSYPKESLAEVSVSYCFICLLHLANENNLDIQASTEGKQDLIIQS